MQHAALMSVAFPTHPSPARLGTRTPALAVAKGALVGLNGEGTFVTAQVSSVRDPNMCQFSSFLAFPPSLTASYVLC